MGNISARRRNPSQSPVLPSPPPLLKDFDLSPPRAAVIGAGIAGVHVAHELAQVGFDVTVYEQSETVASGETRHALPFVGVGLLEPALLRTRMSKEVLKSLLSPSACCDIICHNHFNSLFSPSLYRWLLARRRRCFSDDEVLWYTDNLSRLSLSVVRDLAKQHPTLQQYILASTVSVSSYDSALKVAVPATTASSTPIMLDPVGWTQALASICETKFGVHFAFNHRLERTNTYLNYDVEATRSITVSTPDPKDSSKRIYKLQNYDIVVLTTGANTGMLTWNNSRQPIVGMSGWHSLIDRPTASLSDSIGKLFSTSASGETAAQPELVQLSGRCSLFGYRFPMHHTLTNRLSDGGNGFCLSGLLSLDTTFKDFAPMRYLARLEDYTRVMCDVDLPLVDNYRENALCISSEDANGIPSDLTTVTPRVTVEEYVRAFTPDHVPIVDLSGGAFNTFVCAGFGDHATDFAPGAAKILTKVVQQQAEVLLLEGDAPLREHSMSRLQVLEKEMQYLLNGHLPPLPGQKPERALVNGEMDDLPFKFSGNPFSTNRFTGLIKKEFRDTTHHPIATYVYKAEDSFMKLVEPWTRHLRRVAIGYAQQDGVSPIMQNFILGFWYDPMDDEQLQRNGPAVAKARQELIELLEQPNAERATAWIEASTKQEAENAARSRALCAESTEGK